MEFLWTSCKVFARPPQFLQGNSEMFTMKPLHLAEDSGIWGPVWCPDYSRMNETWFQIPGLPWNWLWDLTNHYLLPRVIVRIEQGGDSHICHCTAFLSDLIKTLKKGGELQCSHMVFIWWEGISGGNGRAIAWHAEGPKSSISASLVKIIR